jgi:dihydroorotase
MSPIVCPQSYRPGHDADVTLIDPSLSWTIDPTGFLSRSRNTPFGGWDVRGRAVAAIVNGEVRYALLGSALAAAASSV